MFPHGVEQLGAYRLGGVAQQRQVAVGGGAGEQIEHALALQTPETRQQVALAGAPLADAALQLRRQGAGGPVVLGGGPLEQLQAPFQPGGEALAQVGGRQQ